MKTVQVSRRSTQRRRLLAAGALSAVVALTYVDSALAAATTCTGASGTLNTETNPYKTSADNACRCVEGYAGASAKVGAVTLDCTQCDTGYYVSTLGTSGASPAYSDAVCSKVSEKVQTTGPTPAAFSTVTALPTPTASADAGCADDYYGLATTYAGAGCTLCPTNSGLTGVANIASATTLAACLTDTGYYLSTAGTGTGTLAAGTITLIPANKYSTSGLTVTGAAATPAACPTYTVSDAGSTGLSDCKTMPGYYVHTASNTATSVRVNQAPAGWYSAGGRAVDATNTAVTATESNALDASTHSAQANDIQVCPYAGTSAAGSSSLADCTPDCSTTNADSGAEALAGTCFCSAGTYQTNGQPTPAASGEAAANGCTKCSTTFASADASAITSDFASTSVADCELKAGYYITSVSGAGNELVTVAPAPAGTFQPEAVNLQSSPENSVLITCPANSNSVAGSAECTCNDGYIVVSTLRGSECQATSAAAASPTADSAGASTPIAVALAAAAAVPLLL